MAISFPNNPSLNDTFTSGGITFTWNGTNWVSSKDSNILADTTPQLGGNLDVNGRDITGTGNINVTGTITATSFSGTLNSSDLTGALPALDGSALTGAGTTTTAEWTLGADGSNHYTFTGPGVTAGATDPTIYLTRGQTYKFKNRSGGHPFRIQTSFQNTGGTAYNDGITNNAAGNGTDLYWEVRNDTPDTLYYQCTAHTNMSGRINMIGGESKVVGLTSTTATARDAGITTATGSIIYIPDVGLQVYAGDAVGWKTIANTSASGSGGAPFSATGGDVTVEPGNGYKYHTFINTGNFVTGSNAGTVEVLIVGGGGGGGDYSNTGNAGGAGGAGGLVHHAALDLSASTTYPIVIGNGGPDSPSPNGTYVGGNGDDSTSFGMTAKGGGGGGGYNDDGATGGSGGGGVGSGPANQTSQNAPFQSSSDFSQFGNAGGTGNAGAGDFGGGGGAGAAGSPYPGGGPGGPGGIGRQYPQFHGNLLNVPSLNPFNGYFAGGGGGGNYPSGAPAPGGLGGGGGPNNNPQSPTDTQPIPGTNGTGGGGAGGSLSHSGGNGGKGIVVIRYQT